MVAMWSCRRGVRRRPVQLGSPSRAPWLMVAMWSCRRGVRRRPVQLGSPSRSLCAGHGVHTSRTATPSWAASSSCDRHSNSRCTAQTSNTAHH